MNPDRQRTIELTLRKLEERVNTLLTKCDSKEEATFAICALAQDMIRKFYFCVNTFIGQQEAKAAIKVALDCVLLDYGMSVVIHEFKQ
jgi:hypothetical protein